MTCLSLGQPDDSGFFMFCLSVQHQAHVRMHPVEQAGNQFAELEAGHLLSGRSFFFHTDIPSFLKAVISVVFRNVLVSADLYAGNCQYPFLGKREALSLHG